MSPLNSGDTSLNKDVSPQLQLASRIKQALDHKGLNWTQAAIQLGFTAQAATNWKKGKIGIDTISAVAKLTGVSLSWLVNNEGLMLPSKFDNNVDLTEAIPAVRMLPIISWVQAGSWTNVIPVTHDEFLGELPAIPGAGVNSFYLKVRGISNAPFFKDGDYICVDPDYQIDEVKTGEMVVVSCGGDATFKALVNEDEKRYLKALNKDWKPRIIPIEEDCRFVGKYKGLFRKETKFNIDD